MSLVQTLLVRNEVDLTVSNIRFHLEMGVDHIVLTDHRSTDGMRDYLSPFIDQSVLTYFHQDAEEFKQSIWMTEMANFADHSLGAEWIINSDNDEFWIAKNGGNLKDEILKHTKNDILIATRHDFVCLEKHSEPFWKNMIYRKTVSMNASGLLLPPKIAHRSKCGITVGVGNHEVHGFDNPRVSKDVLEVLHFPIRSAEQYKRKVIFGGEALSVYEDVPSTIGTRWRNHSAELFETGGIAFLDNNILNKEQVNSGLLDGSLTKDTRVRVEMKKMGSGRSWLRAFMR